MIMMEDGDSMIHPLVDEFYRTGEYDDVASLVDRLIECSRSDICELIRREEQGQITTGTIPQYSSFEDGTTNLIKYLRMAGDFGPSFVEVGKHYLESGHQERAYIKYGENHSKLAQILGMVTIKKEDRKRVYLSEIGFELEKRNEDDQHECFIKLAGLIPIVQYAVKNNIEDDRTLEKVLNEYLSPTTALRRIRNTWYLVAAIRGEEY